MKNVVVISAHPDDEVLGAGGTLLKHLSNGDKLFWIIITNISSKSGHSKVKIKSRKSEIKKVEKSFNFSSTFILDYIPSSLSSSMMSKLISDVSSIFYKIEPEIIYCVNRSDAHTDHKFTFDSVMSCTKSFRFPFIKKVLVYECISETEFAPAVFENYFLPNYFVDISNFIEKKINIFKIYESEIGEHPFPRSIRNIKSLASFRGASVGVDYAESFQLIKFIDKN